MGFLPLGTSTKDQMLLTTRESYSSYMAISDFFTFSPFNASSTVWGSFEKTMVACSTSLVATHQSQGHSLRCLWGLSLHPSCCDSFKPSSYGVTNSSSKEEFDVDSSPSMSFAGLSFKDIWFTFLTSSSSFTTSSTTCSTCFEGGVLSWTLSILLSLPRTQHFDFWWSFWFLHTSSDMLWSLYNTPKTHKVWIWTLICISFHKKCGHMFYNQKFSNDINKALNRSMLLAGFLNQELLLGIDFWCKPPCSPFWPWRTLTHSQVTGWNPLEGFTKSSCRKLRLGNTLPASNSKKG